MAQYYFDYSSVVIATTTIAVGTSVYETKKVSSNTKDLTKNWLPIDCGVIVANVGVEKKGSSCIRVSDSGPRRCR